MSAESRATFFRQSGWLALATAVGGAASYAVHFFAQKMPEADYGVFTTLLQALNLVAIPAIGLQTVFAQQAAAAHSKAEEQQLAATVHVVTRGLVGLWLLAMVALFAFRTEVTVAFKIHDVRALALAAGAGLFALWMPMAYGLLQGRQNFLWYGWAAMLLGVVRLAVVAVLMLAATANATNGIMGVAAGFVIAWAVAWRARGVEPLEPEVNFNWRDWVRRVVPLSIGAGAFIFMMSADMIVVQRFFEEKQTGLYAAAGMIGRALVFLIGPLVAVMFPKIVRGHATGESTQALSLTLGLTAALGVTSGVTFTLFPELPLRLIYEDRYLTIAPLVPWFVWAMVPLTLGAVLSNNLLARGRFTIAWVLGAICIAYAVTLWSLAPSFARMTNETFNVTAYIRVAQVLGAFNLLYLLSAWLLTLKLKHADADQND